MNVTTLNVEVLNSIIQKIEPIGVCNYLTGKGWNRKNINKNYIALFKRPLDQIDSNNYNDIKELKIPLDKELGDYREAMTNVITSIASIDKISLTHIYNNILYSGADIIRVRIDSKDTVNGTIPFEQGFSLFEHAKKALLASACDVIEPDITFHKKLSKGEAKNFISSCRFGQTEIGSYVASIICPLGNKSNQEISLFGSKEDAYMSFPRRVTKHFMNAIEELNTIIETTKIEDINEESFSKINNISSNFIESVISINSQEDGILEINIDWSSLAPEEIQTPRKVILKRENIPALQKIADMLKPKQKENIISIVGKVSNVKANPDAEMRHDGEITIVYTDNGIKASKVKVILNQEDYSLACEAHKNGYTVQVKGVLSDLKKQKALIYQSFIILN